MLVFSLHPFLKTTILVFISYMTIYHSPSLMTFSCSPPFMRINSANKTYPTTHFIYTLTLQPMIFIRPRSLHLYPNL